MNKKIFLLLLLTLVCILSIQVISATGNTANKEVISTDNNKETNLETNIQYDDVSTSKENCELNLEENDNDKEDKSGADETATNNEDPLTFTDLNNIINGNENSTIYLSNDYKFNNDLDRNYGGVIITRDLEIYGNGITIDGNKMARIFKVNNSNLNVKFYNIVFINGLSDFGGAIYRGNAYNCLFTGNNAKWDGGAIYSGYAYNCTFTQNTAAELGGAIYAGNAYNCIFTQNNATLGGGIKFGDAINCTFNGNFVYQSGGAISSGNAYNSIFNENFVENNYGEGYGGGAIYKGNAYNCTFTENKGGYRGGAIYKGNAYNCTFIRNNATQSGTIGYGNAYNCIFIENYALGDGRAIRGNATSCTFIDNYYRYSNAVIGKCTNCTFKYYSKITASPVTITYNVDKYLIITLKDLKNRSIPHAEITVNLDSTKKYKTNDEGQVKVNIANLIPKTYNVKITYAESANKNPTTSIKITVKKATPKITAKSASFKLKVKTKKYAAIFKNNKNQALKNTKVTLKVNGKTYSVKTNTKGIGVFKITNLKKIGSYIAVITVPANTYYNKVIKKVKITVK